MGVSNSQELLDTSGSRTVIGARRFSCAVPLIWNNLSYNVRSAELLEPFVPDRRVIYFPSLHHRHAISLLIH